MSAYECAGCGVVKGTRGLPPNLCAKCTQNGSAARTFYKRLRTSEEQLKAAQREIAYLRSVVRYLEGREVEKEADVIQLTPENRSATK